MKYYYQCLNPSCRNYGIEIQSRVPLTNCRYCESYLGLVRTEEEAPPEGTRTAAGAIGGALLGWAVGGPVGAFIGLLIGGALGASVEEEDRRKRRFEV